MNDELSIVTISYNAASTIERTIESVLIQTYKSYEYIIIDGGSNDGTVDIIKKYISAFKEKGIRYAFISERDRGIYDAMNKALSFCNNKWVLYLNANDILYTSTTIEEVFGSHIDDYDYVYGDTINTSDGVKYYRKALPLESITYTAPYIQQAMFIKRRILRDYGFNTKYKIGADYDLMCRLYVAKAKNKHIGIPIACYDLGGISNRLRKESHNEQMDILKSNGLENKNRLKRFLFYNIVVSLKSISGFKNIYVRFRRIIDR